MKLSFQQRIIAIAAAGLLWRPAVADDVDIDSEYYRQTVFLKASGVYEHSGVLYVQSVCPLEGGRPMTSQSKLAAKRDALLGLDSLLKSWAIDNTEQLRGKPRLESEGLEYAAQVLAARNRNWRYASWRFDSLPVRQMYCSIDGARFVAAFAIQKEKLLAKLPASFCQACTGEEVLEALPRFLGPSLIGSTRAKALTVCGVCDVIGTVGVDVSVSTEFEQVNVRVSDYFANSEFGKMIREEERRLAVPNSITNRTLTANVQGTRSEERVEIITVTCVPRFQRLLLNVPGETNAPFARMASGAKAIALAFDKNCSAADQESYLKAALEENPGDKELWDLYGRALMGRGENLAAVSCFRNVLVLDSSYSYSLVNLAKAYMALGFRKLSWGLAVSVLGGSKDAWSLREARALLMGEKSVATTTNDERDQAATISVSQVQQAPEKGLPLVQSPQDVTRPAEASLEIEVMPELDY